MNKLFDLCSSFRNKTTPAFNQSCLITLVAAAMPLTMPTRAQDQGVRPAPVASETLSISHEVRRAIDKGQAWLEKSQDAAGFWSTPDHAAVTALALIALQGRTAQASGAAKPEVVKKGYDFLLRSVKPDGGIYGSKGLANYNTAISMMALLASGQEEYRPIILKAREFIIGLQSDFDTAGQTDNVFDGGVGYGSRYQHSDMSNTLMALEALYHSKRLLQDQKLAGARDLNWAAAIRFIQNCQNLPGSNSQPWASDDPQNRGGFVYYPGHSMAGETNLTGGRVALRSYGSISYAGLLSYIYADLKRDDPRVQAVLDWLKENYTLEENPGMGPQGLFYYFHTMAKALSVYGLDVLQTKEGKKIDWRKELALKLINLQQPNGSWVNENARWWENDPALVTAYAVIALEFVHRQL